MLSESDVRKLFKESNLMYYSFFFFCSPFSCPLINLYLTAGLASIAETRTSQFRFTQLLRAVSA